MRFYGERLVSLSPSHATAGPARATKFTLPPATRHPQHRRRRLRRGEAGIIVDTQRPERGE